MSCCCAIGGTLALSDINMGVLVPMPRSRHVLASRRDPPQTVLLLQSGGAPRAYRAVVLEALAAHDHQPHTVIHELERLEVKESHP
jgi:hypothetical protein